MTARLGPLVVEAADVLAVQAFWASAIGPEACERLVRVVPQSGPKTVKNRVHLDVAVREVDALWTLGARTLDEYGPHRFTLADVEGNEFCAFVDTRLESESPARPFAVCTDSADPTTIAAWWAPRVGARVGPGPDGAPRYLSGCAGWPGLTWKFVAVHDARTAPNRWTWTVEGGTFACSVDPDGNTFVQRP